MRSALAVGALAAVTAGSALAAEWQIDPAHSGVHFSVKHMMVSNVRGEFGKVSGTFVEDEKDITKSTANINIEASTIYTRDEKRDAHLKSEEFFDVQKHPTITFKANKFQKAGKDKYKVTGDLTIKTTTKPVTFDVTLTPKATKDPWGSLRRGGTAVATINRNDFGLKWNKALETGGVLVGDDVKIEVDFSLTRPDAAKATN